METEKNMKIENVYGVVNYEEMHWNSIWSTKKIAFEVVVHKSTKEFQFIRIIQIIIQRQTTQLISPL